MTKPNLNLPPVCFVQAQNPKNDEWYRALVIFNDINPDTEYWTIQFKQDFTNWEDTDRPLEFDSYDLIKDGIPFVVEGQEIPQDAEIVSDTDE